MAARSYYDLSPDEKASLVERFLKYVPLAEEGECWEWQGPKSGNGYGHLSVGKSIALGAHRLSYELHRGPAHKMCVLHRCDNPLCVNPAHLWLGTQSENIQDRTSKGRTAAKLTPKTVQEIRVRHANGETMASLAARHNVDPSTIRGIITGRTWKHVVGNN